MSRIVPIVEGDGEVEAVPILLRKVLGRLERWDIDVARPKNAHSRNNLLKVGGIERFIQLAVSEPDCRAVLVLVDADNDCSVELGANLAERVRLSGCLQPAAVVCATREYEAWFLASLESIAGRNVSGKSGLPTGLKYEGDVESLRGVKEWLSKQFPKGRAYKETLDQSPLTQHLEIDQVLSRSRSFRRLYHAIEELTLSIDGGSAGITP